MKALDRLEVAVGLQEGIKAEVETARGLSEENFKALSPAKQIKYIKEHPNSKYSKESKWLKRAKMLETRTPNQKKTNKSKEAVKPTPTTLKCDNEIKNSPKSRTNSTFSNSDKEEFINKLKFGVKHYVTLESDFLGKRTIDFTITINGTEFDVWGTEYSEPSIPRFKLSIKNMVNGRSWTGNFACDRFEFIEDQLVRHTDEFLRKLLPNLGV